MTFTCKTNSTEDRNWHVDGNTEVSDGFDLSSTNFRKDATDETILRSYLRSYQFSHPDDEDQPTQPRWMEFTIHSRPEDFSYNRTYYVQVNDACTRATVTDRQPTGELRWDGFRY